MRKISLILIMFSLFTLWGCATGGGGAYYSQAKSKRLGTLAIVDFLDKFQPERGKALAADLRRELAERQRTTLIPPEALAEALREEHLASPAYLEPAAARKLGQRLKAELIVTGRLIDFQWQEKITNVPLLWTTTKYMATYKLELCLVKTLSPKQKTITVTGYAEVKKREIQLFELGTETLDLQLISAAEKQRLIDTAYEDLIRNLIGAVLA